MEGLKKNKRGITLVALVVTIVILLILAGVSLNLVLGNNGIIKKAGDAGDKYSNASANEQEQLSTAEDDIEKMLGTYDPLKKVPEKTLEEAKSNDMLSGTETTKVILTDGTVVIPAGYKITDDSASTVAGGVVITDAEADGNEWVWVPVANVNTMYIEGEKTLLGTTGDTAVITKGYSNLRVRSGESWTITTPGNSSEIREPDLLSSYDTDEAYYKTILGFDSKEEMGEAFVADYEAMIESVSKYKGFYIGRYELSSEGEKKNKEPLVLTNWYNLYKTCRNITGEVAKGKGQTTMIWGCQWDETMSWLKATVFASDTSKVDTDSGSWGNYKDSTVLESDGTTELKASGDSTKLNTGVTTYTMKNNIYDLAGNCWEWTQEAFYTNLRVIRGGFYDNSSSDSPASARVGGLPGISDYTYSSSRATLYVK